MRENLAKNARVVSFYTMLSRVAGLARDTVFGHIFGATHATDAFLMAFTIPNTFRMLVAEGALTVAFVPVFKQTDKEGGQAASDALMRQALAIFPILSGLVVLAGIAGASALVHVFARGFLEIPGKFDLTVTLVQWMFPYLALISFVAMSMGALNSRQRFASSAASPLVFNLVHIACMLTFSQLVDPPMLGVAYGVLLSGGAQVVVQLVALKRAGLLLRPSLRLGPGVRRILALMAPAIASLAVYQLNIAALRFFTSYLDEGAVTYLYNADRFFQLPLGVFSVAIATVSLPALADAQSQGAREQLVGTFRQSLTLNNFITVPATLGLIVLALPISVTILQHGEFTHAMAVNTARALVWLSLGLVAVSGIRLAAQVFFALQDTRTPALCGGAGLVANVALAPLLAARFGFVGLAMSISASAWIQLAVEVFLLRRRVGRLGLARVGRSAARDLTAAAVMAGTAWGISHLGEWTRGFAWLNLGVLVAAIGAGGLVYAVISAFLGAPELAALMGKLVRRSRGRGALRPKAERPRDPPEP